MHHKLAHCGDLPVVRLQMQQAAAKGVASGAAPVEEAGREGVNDGRHCHSPGAVVRVGLDMQTPEKTIFTTASQYVGLTR